jgi:hypothetical protein
MGFRLAKLSSAPTGGLVGAVVAVSAGAAFLLLPVLINGFPFVFPDSEDYLVFTPLPYRSPYYGLFIFFFHLNHFIWAPILVQAVIASHLIWVLVRIFAGRADFSYFFLSILVLSLFSGLPIFVGYIMADFFTPVMLLVLYILCFHWPDLTKIERCYLLLLACVAIASHLTHPPLALIVIACIIVFQIARHVPPRLILIRTGVGSIPIALAILAILVNNIVIHRVFAIYAAGSTLLLANMIEYGPARSYLQEACPAAGYKICPAINDCLTNPHWGDWCEPSGSRWIANRFLWNGQAFRQLGGFAGMRDEAGSIVAATIEARPWDVFDMAKRTAGSALVTHAPGAELEPLITDEWMVDVLSKKFGPSTVRAYKESLQSNGLIPRDFLRIVDNVTFPLALASTLTAGLFALRRGLWEAAALVVLVFVFFVANAVLCSFASGVFDRYQARITWLFPLAALLTVCSLKRSRFAHELSRLSFNTTQPSSNFRSE